MPAEGHQKVADEDGQFRRKDSSFRNWISSDPGAEFSPEKDRYLLYVNNGCPWAHRAMIVRKLKALEEIVPLVVMSATMSPEGWIFDGSYDTEPKDPLYGYTYFRDLYKRADPSYTGRYTVPTLWDKKRETIVNNESSDIIRMFYTCFDSLLSPELQDASRPGGSLLPSHLRSEIDNLNEWVYNDINNGVYKTGFATTFPVYKENCQKLFAAIDRMETHLSSSDRDGPFIFGAHITDADIRLYTTMIRFDTAYYTLFRCNLKMVRYDYPAIHKWLRTLYWDESEETRGGAFRYTCFFEQMKEGYGRTQGKPMPLGPLPHIMPLD